MQPSPRATRDLFFPSGALSGIKPMRERIRKDAAGMPAVGALGKSSYEEHVRGGGRFRPAVVLHHENDRKLSGSGEGESLVNGTLVHRAVADRDPAVALPTFASATPHAIVVPAPTIEFSPMKRVSGAMKYGEPARPPFKASAFWEISAITGMWVQARGQRPTMATVGRDGRERFLFD